MHLLNLGYNVVPRPYRFVINNMKFLAEVNRTYNMPEKCSVDTQQEDQICDDGGQPWTYLEWLLTTKPGAFGLFPGSAFPTGVFLILTLSIMFACSLPFVRRRGNFEIFYFSHLLYVVFFVLLILHAPACYKWTMVPLCLFSIELVYRLLSNSKAMGTGYTHIEAGLLLPSDVTALVIKRPDKFRFSPGDWVFIKIPRVAKFEWHPFTISSAPEENDTFTLHIRAVGGWTHKLRDVIYQMHQAKYVPCNAIYLD
jgi:hypothetical protein